MTPSVDWDLVRSEFSTLLQNYPPKGDDVPTDLDVILDGTDGSLEERLDKARKYAMRLDALKDSSPNGHAFVNGKHLDVNDVCLIFPFIVLIAAVTQTMTTLQELLRYTQVEISHQLQHLQEKASCASTH
jgi:hypothetical protein